MQHQTVFICHFSAAKPSLPFLWSIPPPEKSKLNCFWSPREAKEQCLWARWCSSLKPNSHSCVCRREKSVLCSKSSYTGMVQVRLIPSRTAFVCTTDFWCFLTCGMLWSVLEYKLQSHLWFYIIPFGPVADVQQDLYFIPFFTLWQSSWGKYSWYFTNI